MPLLEIDHVTAGYGDVRVLDGVSLTVEESEIVSLVGANGAGKTTLLRAVSRVLPLGGTVRFGGEDISKLRSDEITARRLAHVPEGRQLFTDMSVEENLLLGAPSRLAKSERKARLDQIHGIFPRLAERRRQLAGTLSGGEQQMAAIGRGLMMGPRLLMLDEPSLGLSPSMVETIFETIVAVNRTGVAILLVEQNVVESLRRSHRAYVVETGRIVLDGRAADVLRDERTRNSILGGGPAAPVIH
jgi:branched-chain amino acid transport system ATP-binding protein